MAEIYLLRHGETQWSKSGQHTGLTDIPLTDNGIKQSLDLKKMIAHEEFEAVFCSPLERAKQTCKNCNLLDKAIITNDLLEWNYGDYEGITSKEIHEHDPKWTIFTKDPPNGETSIQVANRADRLIKESSKYEGKVAFFSSGHFLRALAARWLGFPVSFGAYLTLSTASLSILSFEHDNRVIQEWNSISHNKKAA